MKTTLLTGMLLCSQTYWAAQDDEVSLGAAANRTGRWPLRRPKSIRVNVCRGAYLSVR